MTFLINLERRAISLRDLSCLYRVSTTNHAFNCSCCYCGIISFSSASESNHGTQACSEWMADGRWKWADQYWPLPALPPPILPPFPHVSVTSACVWWATDTGLTRSVIDSNVMASMIAPCNAQCACATPFRRRPESRLRAHMYSIHYFRQWRHKYYVICRGRPNCRYAITSPDGAFVTCSNG